MASGPLTIQTLQEIEFAKSYNWHVGFTEYGWGNRFFPCHGLNDTLVSFKTNNFDYGPWSFHYIEQSGRGSDISLEVFEIDDYSVVTWMLDWAKFVRNEDYTMKLIGTEGVARTMYIHRLNNQKEIIKEEILLVVPSGDVSIPHGSEKSGSLSLTIPLTKVSG